MKSMMQIMAGFLILFLGGCATQQPSKSAVHERETAETYLNRGVAYSQKGEYDRAISDYSEAIEINPRYAIAYNNRGYAYRKKGEYERAISDYSKAIEINPGYAAAYYNRGFAYYHKGEYDKVWEDVYKAQSLGYSVSPGFLKTLRETSRTQK